MDGKDGLILWTLGGAGVLFLYAAYSNKSPRTVLASTLGTATAAAAAPVQAPAAGESGPSGNYSTGTDSTGTNYLFDSDGIMAGVVPAPYQGSAATYIPPGGVYSA